MALTLRYKDFKTILIGEAPIACAASITPFGTETRFVSTILAIPIDATNVIGKIFAAVPIVVPITLLVSGLNATKKIMNGTGRIVLIMMLRIEKTHLFSKSFLFSLHIKVNLEVYQEL